MTCSHSRPLTAWIEARVTPAGSLGAPSASASQGPNRAGIGLEVAQDHEGVEVVTVRGHRSMTPAVERRGTLLEAVSADAIADLVENVDRRALPRTFRTATRSARNSLAFWASRSLALPSSQLIRRSDLSD